MNLLFEHKSHFKDNFQLPRSHNLEDIAVEIAKNASKIGISLNPIVRENIAKLFNEIDCYYSCFIDGESISFPEIRKITKNEYSKSMQQRIIEKECKAYFEMQNAIQTFFTNSSQANILSYEFLNNFSQTFYQKAASDLSLPPKHYLKEYISLKEARTNIPKNYPIKAILYKLERNYEPSNLHLIPKIIAMVASYYFLIILQPFTHRNGKLCRLFTNIYAHKINIDSYGLWSISRGLAAHHHYDLNNRSIEKYISSTELIKFCENMLEMLLAQIDFSIKILEPSRLEKRITNYVNEKSRKGDLRPEATTLLQSALYQGAIKIEKTKHITGLEKNDIESLIQQCLKLELIELMDDGDSLRLDFPNEILPDYFPNLLF